MINNKLEKTIQYTFKNKSLLELALTHSSYLQSHGENKIMCNERLEFIGDGLLDAVIGIKLYELMPESEEGELTKIRAGIVCESSLAKVGKAIHLNQFLRMSKGEEQLGGREKDSITADAVEALIGAVYLDSNYDECKKIILRLFENTIRDGQAHKLENDYKSRLQEEIQKTGSLDELQYILTKDEGPSHNKTFYVELKYCGRVIGTGVGKKKKDAEQEAAKDALEKGKIK